MAWWEIVLLIPLSAGVAAGILGSVAPVLPGPPLILGCCIGYAWATGFRYIGAPTLIGLGLLTILSTVLDYTSGAIGASRAGASRLAVTAAAVTGVISFLAGPLWLVFALPALVVVLIELAIGRGPRRAVLAAGGVGVGNLLNALVKLAISLLMTVLAVLGLLI